MNNSNFIGLIVVVLFGLGGISACGLIKPTGVETQLSPRTETLQQNVMKDISSDDIDGNVRFYLTDAPLDDVEAVNVTVTGLKIKRHLEEADEADEAVEAEDNEWTSIEFDPARVINLKELANGLADALGDLGLPTGLYKEIRLQVSESEVVLKDGTSETLKIPGGSSSGLKIKFKGEGLLIEEGKKYALVIDFDLEKSLKQKGGKSGGPKFVSGTNRGKNGNEAEEESEEEVESFEKSDKAGKSDESHGKSKAEIEDELEGENASVEGSTWILKPVIKVLYLAEVNEEEAQATVLVLDEETQEEAADESSDTTDETAETTSETTTDPVVE